MDRDRWNRSRPESVVLVPPFPKTRKITMVHATPHVRFNSPSARTRAPLLLPTHKTHRFNRKLWGSEFSKHHQAQRLYNRISSLVMLSLLPSSVICPGLFRLTFPGVPPSLQSCRLNSNKFLACFFRMAAYMVAQWIILTVNSDKTENYSIVASKKVVHWSTSLPRSKVHAQFFFTNKQPNF